MNYTLIFVMISKNMKKIFIMRLSTYSRRVSQLAKKIKNMSKKF